jgi:hypothetical protein
MDISLSLIKDILLNNKLISGRLSLTPIDIQKLYQEKFKQNQKIQRNLSKEKKSIKASLDQIKNLKSELKYCEESLQKAFYPSTKNISLIYKNIGNHYYIKARIYWQGLQREVQVGSIPIVLDIIKKMLDQGYLQDILVPKTGNMTWNQFKNKASLIDAAKVIASLKFQEYIIRKLLIEDIDKIEQRDKDKSKDEKLETVLIVEKKQNELSDNKKYEWYAKWRRNNL